ncbi:hypothetical protein CEXT_425491 [Caerostris extrusa]|uniref:Uncharacterized protein n=1 Tax=Caerostris extrusa TaxID=172846 RepID=A0AAV4W4J3_CAEEX|nr:hypothetical protein CEXT_425491 [Caerostris extrusa]
MLERHLSRRQPQRTDYREKPIILKHNIPNINMIHRVGSFFLGALLDGTCCSWKKVLGHLWCREEILLIYFICIMRVLSSAWCLRCAIRDRFVSHCVLMGENFETVYDS